MTPDDLIDKMQSELSKLEKEERKAEQNFQVKLRSAKDKNSTEVSVAFAEKQQLSDRVIQLSKDISAIMINLT